MQTRQQPLIRDPNTLTPASKRAFPINFVQGHGSPRRHKRMRAQYIAQTMRHYERDIRQGCEGLNDISDVRAIDHGDGLADRNGQVGEVVGRDLQRTQSRNTCLKYISLLEIALPHIRTSEVLIPGSIHGQTAETMFVEKVQTVKTTEYILSRDSIV